MGFALMKGLFPCKAFSCSCRSVSWGSSTWGCASATLSAPLQTDRLMEECFFFCFLGDGGGLEKGRLKVEASKRNLPHSLNSIYGGTFFIWRCCSSSRSCSARLENMEPLLCTPFHNYFSFFPPSFIPPSFQPSVPLKCAIGRSLSGASSLLGLAVCLCFISPTKRWARMRDLCVRFPLRLCSPNVKLVYLGLWQSFSTPRMLLWMIITRVWALGTIQCGQSQLQMVEPVEDINSGNVKMTLREVKAGWAKCWES